MQTSTVFVRLDNKAASNTMADTGDYPEGPKVISDAVKAGQDVPNEGDGVTGNGNARLKAELTVQGLVTQNQTAEKKSDGLIAGDKTSNAERALGDTDTSRHVDTDISESKEDGGLSTPGFIHLHTHSAYSLLEGAIQPNKLIELAVEDGQPALALTDRNNLFGALEFAQKAPEKGVQPIMGCMISIDPDLNTVQVSCEFGAGEQDGGGHEREGFSEPETITFSGQQKSGTAASTNDAGPSLKQMRELRAEADAYGQIVLLAMNEAGFNNLTRLVSDAHLEGEDNQAPHIKLGRLFELGEGIIVLSGGSEGPIDRYLADQQMEKAQALTANLARIFGDRFYIELQRQDGYNQAIERQLIDLAYAHEIGLVATNQPFFARREDHEAHDALICIAQGAVVGQDDRRKVPPSQYFKSRNEMMQLFADLPEALGNTVEIAKRCLFRAPVRKPILPNFIGTQDAGSAELELLRKEALAGLDMRLETRGLAPGFEREAYFERIEFELGIIEEMGFPGYFLIVADFINWAKEQDIPVGPGRGSGAGSVVAWSLKITDLDPLQFGLLFERFLNPERLSMPDFDVDFCQDRRGEVISYVQEKYGRDRVAQIITYGTLQARAVLRDVGRVMQMPYGQVDRLCKLVPANPANPVTLAQAVDGEPKLQEARREEEIVDRLINISMRLEGLYRHASTHAAGVVIGDRRLSELVPLYRDPRSTMPVSQYNMKWVEQAGLVKFDFLGLKNLTVIKRALEFIGQSGIDLDIESLDIRDKQTFEMLTKGETVGVFQLESQGMRKALIGMKPDRFEDIIALVALYRPGPMDNIPTYNAVKNGEQEPDYYDDKIKHILEETYGVIIYQEQVLQIARVLSGYSLGEADFLRKAMGKKIKEEMDAQRVRFVEGAVEREMPKTKANMIFDVLAKFAGYGFNKAHAAAYALISYQTAYLKCHYPVEFLAASMQLDMGNTDKLNIFHQEAQNLEIEVVAPSVQESFADFTVKKKKIHYALAAIKGVGQGAVEQIVVEREENGLYQSLTDFFSRIDSRHLNRRTLENLICAGALDCFGKRREAILAGLDRLLDHANRTVQDREMGQGDMFGSSGEQSEIELPMVEAWMPSEKLQREHQSIGYYFSAHPLDEYRGMLEEMRVQLIRDFEVSVKAGSSAGRLAGTITGRQERKTRTGKRMGIVMVSDPSGQYEAVIFEEGLDHYRDLLEPGSSVVIFAAAEMRPEGLSVRIQSVRSLQEEAAREHKNMRIYVRDETPVAHFADLLNKPGDGQVSVVVIQDQGAREVEIQLPKTTKVDPAIMGAIKGMPDVLDVELV